MDPLIICVAPYPGDSQTERGPKGLDTVAEVLSAHRAGASLAHLHVRDSDGWQTTDPALFADQVEKIKTSCDIVIEGSTGGTTDHTLEERSASLSVPGPELGSLNMGSINMGEGIYGNPIGDIHYYARKMKEQGIKPFLVIFDLSMIFSAIRLAEEGLIPDDCAFNLVFDAPQTMPYSDKVLKTYLEYLPPGNPWFLTRHHAPGAEGFRATLELGGHVRVGFEDGPFLSSGERAGSNTELVEEVVHLAQAVGRSVVDTQGARRMLGLSTAG